MDTPNEEPYSCGDEVAANSVAFNSFVAGSTNLIMADPPKLCVPDKYDKLMQHFDQAVLDEIRKDVMLSCMDVLWDQAYSEGYRRGISEVAEDVPLRNLTGKDSR